MKNLRKAFAEGLPVRPYCVNELGYRLLILSKAKAMSKRYIQLNSPNYLRFMIFDIDHEDSTRWQDEGLPEPAFQTFNKDDGKCHLIYELSHPVSKMNHRSYKYYKAVWRGLNKRLRGDTAYNGMLTKNPFHSEFRAFKLNAKYNLDFLNDFLVFEDKQIDFTAQNRINVEFEDIQKGYRNQSFFDIVRLDSYSKVKECNSELEIYEYCLYQIEKLNNGITEQINVSEIKSIARSISKFSWKNRENFGNFGYFPPKRDILSSNITQSFVINVIV